MSRSSGWSFPSAESAKKSVTRTLSLDVVRAPGIGVSAPVAGVTRRNTSGLRNLRVEEDGRFTKRSAPTATAMATSRSAAARRLIEQARE